ncbi:MAG: Gldg family protein [Candidatus Omnitrophica bacterium]|nr:Gldg family protein [Candidatus Omnitrophota bacterium]
MKSLSNILTVFRRELSAYFNAAIAYIFIIVFVLLNGGLFMTQFFVIDRADMRPFFGTLPFILSVFLPAVTMRLWAEEKRGNTLELLLTFPMATHELVLGKFLASLLFYFTALAGTFTIPVMLSVISRPDLGVVFGGYLGAALLGAFYLAIGIFISGLCRDQIVSFILSMMICFGLFLVGTEFLSSSIDGWIPGLGSFFSQFLGTSSHFDSFAKGVIDGGDLLYFVIGSLIFLVLNGFWLEGRMRPRAKSIFATATLICAGIFLTTNWLFAGVSIGRFDLTEGKIYTIAPATKKILRELKAPVTAKFYVSPVDKMPTGMKTIEQDVLDKLDEFKVASGGNFNYKIFRMEAANVVEGTGKAGEESLEEQLQKKGIQPFQVRAIVSDEVAVRLIYSSISVAYKEKPEEIIARVYPDNLDELEYMLASKIYRMTLSSIPKIALVAPYEEKSVEPEVQALLAQLGGQAPEAYREDNYELLPLALEYEGYEVSRIQLNEKESLPEDVKTVVIVEPRELNERQKYEISRFLSRGGSVFLAVQNYEYQYAPSGRDLSIFPKEKKPEVNPLLENWGLEVDEQILVDEQSDVINLSGAARLGPFEVSVPVKVPIQILITQEQMNSQISVTSNLASLFYLWGTAIKPNEEKIKDQKLKVDTLFSSSRQSWTVPFQSGSLQPAHLEYKAESSRKGPFPLAVYVQGIFADAYKDKAVPEWPKTEPAASAEETKEEAKKEELKSEAVLSPAPGKLIVVGAATLFQKHLVKGGGNLQLFMNSVDILSLGEELVTIRSKRPIDRSVGRVPSAAKMGWRFFVTVLIPVILAVLGALRLFLRRQTKSLYLKSLQISSVS